MTKDKIFINIAAYNEEDLFDTVESAYKKATNPENINMGILLHYTDQNFPDLSKFKNVKFMKISDRVGLGLGMSRGLASSFYNQEDYYMQIDAHTVFKTNWDSILIKNYKKLKNRTEKPIISAYAPYYYRDKDTGQKVTMANNQDWESYFPSWTLVPKTSTEAIDMDEEKFYTFAYHIEALNSPASKIPQFDDEGFEEHYLVSGHFLFTPGSFVNDIKYDPLLAYHEENVIALMAWTRGYRIFNMEDHVLWTRAMYAGKDSPNSWKQNYLEKNESGVCFRDKVILGTLRNKEILTGKVLGDYGAPSQELLNRYQEQSKINYKKFYNDMYDIVQKTGYKYVAAKALYDLDKEING